MSAAWDSSPALSPVPWGERSREAFNSVPGDQQVRRLVGVRDGGELLSIGAKARDERRTVPPHARWRAERTRSERRRASAGLLIAGALSQRARTGRKPRDGRSEDRLGTAQAHLPIVQ